MVRLLWVQKIHPESNKNHSGIEVITKEMGLHNAPSLLLCCLWLTCPFSSCQKHDISFFYIITLFLDTYILAMQKLLCWISTTRSISRVNWSWGLMIQIQKKKRKILKRYSRIAVKAIHLWWWCRTELNQVDCFIFHIVLCAWDVLNARNIVTLDTLCIYTYWKIPWRKLFLEDIAIYLQVVFLSRINFSDFCRRKRLHVLDTVSVVKERACKFELLWVPVWCSD